MIFEEMGLLSVETAMGEYLLPNTVIFDVRQWWQIFLRNVRPTRPTKRSLSNVASDGETGNKTHRRRGRVSLWAVEVFLAGS